MTVVEWHIEMYDLYDYRLYRSGFPVKKEERDYLESMQCHHLNRYLELTSEIVPQGLNIQLPPR